MESHKKSVVLCDIAAILFDAIGDSESSAYAVKLSDDIRKAFRNKLINPRGSLKISSQTTVAMAIYYGMFEEAELPKAYQKLELLIHKCADRMDFGVLGNRSVFRVLAKLGKIDLALDMMLNSSFRYWLEQLSLFLTATVSRTGSPL